MAHDTPNYDAIIRDLESKYKRQRDAAQNTENAIIAFKRLRNAEQGTATDTKSK